MTHLYAGIADAINQLDSTTPSASMTLLNGRRAFNGPDGPYVDYVHFRPVSESWALHEKLQKAFMHRPDYQGRVYAGTAGEVNLTYIATSKAPAAILYDINPLQKAFWDMMIDHLAAHDNINDFVQSMTALPYRLCRSLMQDFNIAADTPRYRLNFEDPFPLKGRSYGRKTSPLLNMRYDDFEEWFQLRAGHEGTGYIFCGDKDVTWLQNPDQYHHLHAMARHGAMAAITLDITDSPCIEQLRTTLDSLSYRPLNVAMVQDQNGAPEQLPCQKGMRIETLYTSNIGYYLQWTDQEIASQKEQYGEDPVDFCGRPITTETWRHTLNNLRQITDKNALIMHFDQVQEGFLGRPDFHPRFKVQTGHDLEIPRPLDPGGLIADIV